MLKNKSHIYIRNIKKLEQEIKKLEKKFYSYQPKKVRPATENDLFEGSVLFYKNHDETFGACIVDYIIEQDPRFPIRFSSIEGCVLSLYNKYIEVTS